MCWATLSAGSDFGDVNYDMIWFSQGIRDGISKGKNAQPDY
jgi:hypothetical protein